MPRISRATEKVFRFPAKYSPSWRAVSTSTGCRSSSINSPRRTRLGQSFCHKIAARPLSLATSFSLPTGESIILYAKCIILTLSTCAGLKYVSVCKMNRAHIDFAIRRPEVLGCVGAPRPPRLRAFQQACMCRLCPIHVSGAAKQPNICDWKCIHLTHSAERDVLCGPFANAVNPAQPDDRFFHAAERTKQACISHRGFGERFQCPQSRYGHRQSDRRSGGQTLRCWEDMRERRMNQQCLWHRTAMACDELSSQSPRGGHADLLPEHGAHSRLEAVPAAGRAQPGPLSYQRSQGWIARQMLVDRLDVGTEIELTAHSGHDGRQRANIREADIHAQALPVRQMRNFDASRSSIDLHGAQIAALFNNLYARNRTSCEKVEHRIPVIGRPVAEPQRDILLLVPRGALS